MSEATWKNLVNTSSVTGPGADVIANRIPVGEREYVTKEVFFSTSVAPRISKGVRGSYTMSSFTSYDKKKDEVSEYKMSTYTVGAGTHDLGISVGLGYYFVDTYEQMQNINKSFGGSITFLGKTVGLDFMASSDSSSFYLSDFFNIRRVRMYIGQSFVPAKKEIHGGFIDKATTGVLKKYNTMDFYEKESLPSNIRQYYQNYYKEGSSQKSFGRK